MELSWNYAIFFESLEFFQVYFWEVFALTDSTRAFTRKSEYGPEIGRFTRNYKIKQSVNFFLLRCGVLKILNLVLF